MTKHAIALVTGGAGFIGSRLVDRLIQSGYDVRVIDDFSNGRLKNIEAHIGRKGFKLVKGSINRSDNLKRAMKDVDTVFHLAAVVSIQRSLEEPGFVNEVNVGGTLTVLEEARRRDVGRVVFASSAAVYGDRNRPPIEEDCSLAPLSPYGATKAAGEAYCSAYGRTYGMDTVVLRYFNVYGPRRSPSMYSGVMTRFAAAALGGKPLIVYGDGNQTRDFVHVDDVVAATVAAGEAQKTGGEIFNVGTGHKTSILELARLFLSLAPVRRREIIHAEPRLGDIRRSWADVRKAKAILGYESSVKLRSGLESFLLWYSSEYHSRRLDRLATR